MIVTLQIKRIRTVDEVQTFVKGSEAVDFSVKRPDYDKRYMPE